MSKMKRAKRKIWFPYGFSIMSKDWRLANSRAHHKLQVHCMPCHTIFLSNHQAKLTHCQIDLLDRTRGLSQYVLSTICWRTSQHIQMAKWSRWDFQTKYSCRILRIFLWGAKHGAIPHSCLQDISGPHSVLRQWPKYCSLHEAMRLWLSVAFANQRIVLPGEANVADDYLFGGIIVSVHVFGSIETSQFSVTMNIARNINLKPHQKSCLSWLDTWYTLELAADHATENIFQ